MRSNNTAVIIGGALLGAVAGYLFFSEGGREFRLRLERSIEDAVRELSSFRDTMERAAAVVNDGRRILNDAMGDKARQPMRYPNARQTSPF